MSISSDFDTKKTSALRLVNHHAGGGGSMMELPESALMAFVPGRFIELIRPETVVVTKLTAADLNHLNIGVTAEVKKTGEEGRIHIKLSQTHSSPKVLTVEYFEVSKNIKRLGVGTSFYRELNAIIDIFDIVVIRGMNNRLNLRFYTDKLGRYPSRALKRSFFRDFGIEPLVFGEQYCTYAILEPAMVKQYVRLPYLKVPIVRSWFAPGS